MRMYMIAALLIALFAPAAVQAVEPSGMTKIADGVYAYADVGPGSPNNRFGANAGIVVGDREVLVVDTLTSAQEAENMIRDIRQITDKPITYVVNTHYHLDHALGNSAFDDIGAVIVAHEKCREWLIASGDFMLGNPAAFGLEPEYWAGTRIAAPDITFTREFSVDLGNMVVKVIHPGVASHSAGSVLVHVPDRKVVFTGDILFTDFHPYMGDASADLDGWAQTLDFVGAMDVQSIVPGHGPLSGQRDLADMKEYMVIFDAKARELAASMSDPALIADEMLKVLPRRSDGAFIVGMTLGARYLKKAEAPAE